MPVISTKPYNTGDLIFESIPILYCLHNDFKSFNCDNCFEISSSLKKCSKCLRMYYCSKNCQQNDWIYHKNECKIYRHKNFQFNETIDSDRLLLRLWLCMESDPDFQTKPHKLLDGSETSLKEKSAVFKDSVVDDIVLINFKGFCFVLRSCGLQFNEKELLVWHKFLSHYCSFLRQYNDNPSEEVFKSFNKTTGIGIFLNCRDLSHSCLPNSNTIANGLKHQIRAIQSITTGEEITIPMVSLFQSKISRHHELKSHNLSVCQCTRCRLNLDKDIDYSELQKFMAKHDFHWNLIGKPSLAALYNKDYLIDWSYILYIRDVCGQHNIFTAQALVLSFVCFALYSKHSSKPLIRLWYNQIEPIVMLATGSDHPIYKLLQNVYNI